MTQREQMQCDVVIVGAGIAGLSAAIKLRQLALEQKRDISVYVLEKGAQVGAHILSGAVIETRVLDVLLPDWRLRNAPITTKVQQEAFQLLTKTYAVRLPTPPSMHNTGNYIVSLGEVCRWLAREAEALGVNIFCGFAASDNIIENNSVCGVITGDMGIAKDGTPNPSYQQGIEIRAKVTLIAEGCRGSLAEQLMKQFNLRTQCDPQTYAIGIKEVWEIDPAQHKEGSVVHTVGYPLPQDTYGGSFIYHAAQHRIYIGFVTGLDYRNPYLDPYQEFQKFKMHPMVAKLLEGGKRIEYGARALNEGGFQSIPTLSFAGGALIGCSAGFMNVPKIKGSHTAMQSGMCAAIASFEHITQGTSLQRYEALIKESFIWDELHKVRNIRPSFHKGLWLGLLYSAIDTYLLRGRAPWTFHYTSDYQSLKKAKNAVPPLYPKADGKLTFDRMSSVYLSGTMHEENQPAHLVLNDKDLPISYTLPQYAEPAQRYCPAGVYEIIDNRFHIHAENCVHCKTCDIKEPSQNIHWVPPEGGGGPNYNCS